MTGSAIVIGFFSRAGVRRVAGELSFRGVMLFAAAALSLRLWILAAALMPSRGTHVNAYWMGALISCVTANTQLMRRLFLDGPSRG